MLSAHCIGYTSHLQYIACRFNLKESMVVVSVMSPIGLHMAVMKLYISSHERFLQRSIFGTLRAGIECLFRK